MDLLDILKKQIDGLPEGAHSLGLRAVVRHIEVAESHLTRGVEQKDDAAFTDAVYRTNQAFEGSIKEAYRVLAEKNPAKSNIYTIENYLQTNKIFRERVLAQFRNYRTEWRNPSTHDYSLDFDEDEALLAIVSVSAFAKLLIDQVVEKLTFEAVKAELQQNPIASFGSKSQDLVSRLATHLKVFNQIYAPASKGFSTESESQLMGAIYAYLSSVAPELNIAVEPSIGLQAGANRRPDFVVAGDQGAVVIEVKRRYYRVVADQSIEQMKSYIPMARAIGGIIYFSGEPGDKFIVERHTLDEAPEGLALVAPIRRRPERPATLNPGTRSGDKPVEG